VEKSHSSEELMKKTPKATMSEDNMQLSFFQLDDPVLEQVREEILKTDLNSLTPIEAMNKLNEIKKMVGGK
jgi:DNA mismatch repair protein MutS